MEGVNNKDGTQTVDSFLKSKQIEKKKRKKTDITKKLTSPLLKDKRFSCAPRSVRTPLRSCDIGYRGVAFKNQAGALRSGQRPALEGRRNPQLLPGPLRDRIPPGLSLPLRSQFVQRSPGILYRAAASGGPSA